jgi:hypothetical protein
MQPPNHRALDTPDNAQVTADLLSEAIDALAAGDVARIRKIRAQLEGQRELRERVLGRAGPGEGGAE